MSSAKLVLVIAVAVFGSSHAEKDPIVQLPKGKIRGHILKSESGKSYYAFQEIPYAAPPVGANRFKLAKDPEAWSGIKNTTKNTVICYQERSEYKNLKMNEDCLYLNVYTPVAPGSPANIPVAFWIHGGHFKKHSSTFEYCGPKYLMDHGIVVVTVLYRQGPYGFLTTGDDVLPANLGLKDQILAMEWVQDNIHLFGGNKSHVTIAGESSGGMSVSYHLSGPWPNNRTLFHAAIIQSGATLFLSRTLYSVDSAYEVGKKLNSSFTSKNSKELLKVLQKASSADIWKAAGDLDYTPIIEKKGPFSFHTYRTLFAGLFKKVPVYFGFNSEERITESLQQDQLKQKAARIDADPSRLLGRNFNISDVKRMAAGSLLTRIYTNTTFAENLGAVIRWSSDDFVGTPTIKQATFIARHAPVFLYEFAFKGKLGKNYDLPNIQGCDNVGHAEDLNYMWDDQSNSDLSKFAKEEALTLHRFVKLWTNFVKFHNPTPEVDELLENISWPQINPDNFGSIEFLNLNRTLEVQTNPRYYQKVIKVYDQYVTRNDIV